MADHRLDLAEALLAKARSTSFDGERESFVAGAYSQLGAFLGEGSGGGRRPRGARPQARALDSRPAASLPAPAPAEVAADGEGGDPAKVLDLAAAERAYRSQRGWASPGALVDLTI